MEEMAVLLIPVLVGGAVLRLMLLPVKMIVRVLIHCAGGFACLWLLNSVAPFTGIFFPINAVTVLTAGVFGLPGIGVLAVLAVL